MHPLGAGTQRIEEEAREAGVTAFCSKPLFVSELRNLLTRPFRTDLADKPKADALLIPQTMLRDDDEIFLDDTTVAQVEEALGMEVIPVLNDGYEFIENIIGEELEF